MAAPPSPASAGLGLAVTIAGVGRSTGPGRAGQGRTLPVRFAGPDRVRGCDEGPAGTRALQPGSAPGFVPATVAAGDGSDLRR